MIVVQATASLSARVVRSRPDGSSKVITGSLLSSLVYLCNSVHLSPCSLAISRVLVWTFVAVCTKRRANVAAMSRNNDGDARTFQLHPANQNLDPGSHLSHSACHHVQHQTISICISPVVYFSYMHVWTDPSSRPVLSSPRAGRYPVVHADFVQMLFELYT